MMSVNIIDIIHKKYLQARKALYKNTLNLTSAIGGGNKTRDKINRFNLLSVLVSYVEGKSRPSTKVEGKDTTYIALEDIQIEAYIGSPPGEGSLEGGPQGFFTFAKNPLHLYTTDVYGNTATIAYLEPNWGLSNGTNGLAEIFTGVLTDSITVFGIVSNVIPYTTGVETNAQIHLAVERLKANIVNAVNSRDSVFSAALSNGVVKIKARDTALYNGSSIESSSRGISFTSSPRLFVRGVSKVEETNHIPPGDVESLLRVLDVIAAELRIVYDESEDVNYVIDSEGSSIVEGEQTSDILFSDMGGLSTESGENLEG